MEKRQLIYMKDSAGNNLKVFNSIIEASEYIGVSHFDLLKHIFALPNDSIPFKFEVREYKTL